MQKGLVGEALEIYLPENYNLVNWAVTDPPVSSRVTWYATVSYKKSELYFYFYYHFYFLIVYINLIHPTQMGLLLSTLMVT
jgi:hypothetical protein